MAGKRLLYYFEVHKTQDGTYRWWLLRDRNTLVAQSVPYPTYEACNSATHSLLMDVDRIGLPVGHEEEAVVHD